MFKQFTCWNTINTCCSLTLSSEQWSVLSHKILKFSRMRCNYQFQDELMERLCTCVLQVFIYQTFKYHSCKIYFHIKTYIIVHINCKEICKYTYKHREDTWDCILFVLWCSRKIVLHYDFFKLAKFSQVGCTFFIYVLLLLFLRKSTVNEMLCAVMCNQREMPGCAIQIFFTLLHICEIRTCLTIKNICLWPYTIIKHNIIVLS